MTLEMELERMKRGGELIGEERGEKRGVEKGKLDVARELLRDGIPVEKIAQYTGLDLKTLKKALEGLQTRSDTFHE